MIRITYTHYCDKCSVQLEHEKVEYRDGMTVLPLPSRDCWAFGMVLCDKCRDKVQFALREAFA